MSGFRRPWYRLFGYRQRRLLSSALKRALRWEFWPLWLFYIPVGFYIFLLIVRYRGLSFTAVNPGMEGSGFIGEKKSRSLLALQGLTPERVALTQLIPCNQSTEQQLQQCLAFMEEQGLSFPIILKPDSGQRGIDVAIVDNEKDMTAYLQQARFDSILQEYVEGIEFGIFYYRKPNIKSGSVFSLTHKCFPAVIGDGSSTLEELILSHPRLHYMAKFLLAQHKDQLHSVPAADERVNVVRLGSHCRGSLFLDGKAYFTEAVENSIDKISQQLAGFYFGRYDVRAKDMTAFQRGNFKVIEVNGVTSESTNIYDPKNSVITAYKILFEQWRLAFEIGQQNIVKGHSTMSLFDLLHKARIMNREVKA